MLTRPRWEAECRVMKYRFPTFEPFAEPGQWAGFRGWLQGKRTGRIYEVVLRAPISKYPSEEPAVYLTPRPEPHHYIQDGRLCYLRKGHVWKPAEDTFAQVLVIVAKYVDEFDGRG
ncbi:MAG: hypothetical protein M1423_07430 [Acidobacteria bacterium]|nr:hypothetical protein [Acidobacteriota bacterium]